MDVYLWFMRIYSLLQFSQLLHFEMFDSFLFDMHQIHLIFHLYHLCTSIFWLNARFSFLWLSFSLIFDKSCERRILIWNGYNCSVLHYFMILIHTCCPNFTCIYLSDWLHKQIMYHFYKINLLINWNLP